MLERPQKTRIDLPEELLCAYVEGKTTPEEERQLLQMMAANPLLAQFVQDMEETMSIIDMDFDESLTGHIAYSVTADSQPNAVNNESLSLDDADTLSEEDADILFDKEVENRMLEHQVMRRELRRKEEELRQWEEKLRRQKKELQRREEKFRLLEEDLREQRFYLQERQPKSHRQAQPRYMAAESRPMPMRSRITPNIVHSLRDDQIFVFGSNPWGMHNGGASRLAKERFGAIQGQAEGLQGHSYAIPTIVGSVGNIAVHVNRFLAYAKEHPELHFLVTRIGCGTAGYDPADIAPLFVKAKDMENVSLPQDFWDVLRRMDRK